MVAALPEIGVTLINAKNPTQPVTDRSRLRLGSNADRKRNPRPPGRVERRARAREEAAGIVHWLRPEYQIPKFGGAAEKLDLRGGKHHAPETAAASEKRVFPKQDLDQTDAVVAALFRSGRQEASSLAARFKQGRKIQPQIDAVLASLIARGEVARLDGGYVLQR